MTNMIWARKLQNKSSTEVNNKLWAMLVAYKRILKSIVTDNGSEFAGHQWITKKLGVPVYFADPYSAWQKGAVEHANKLLRQYIPKYTNFDEVSQEDIDRYCKLINSRPRKKLQFKTPEYRFFSNFP